MRFRVLASIAAIGCLWWMRSHSSTKHERDDEDSAGQQSQPNDGVIKDRASVSLVLDSMLKEYKARNAKTDRQRPQDQAGQQGVVRWTFIYTVVTGAILFSSLWQSVSVQGQLNAALTSNRAWISIVPQASAPLTFDFNGGHFRVSLTLKNVGRSPATQVDVAVKGGVLMSGQPYATLDILSDLCRKASRDVFAPITLFPDEQYVAEKDVTIDQEDVDRGTFRVSNENSLIIVPLLFVCVVYNDPGRWRGEGRTAYAYSVGTQVEDRGALGAVPLDGEKDSQKPLILRQGFFGNGLVE